MSLMSKLLISAAVITVSISAGTFDLTSYIKKNIVKNPDVKVVKVKTTTTRTIPSNPNWKAYLVIVELKYKGKDIQEPMTIFVDEKAGLVSMDLMDANSGKSYKRSMKPDIPDSYYDDAHLIAGKNNAKHKMVIFSDPQCPFCMEFVPGALKDFDTKKGEVALYYYHMPLIRLHPVSEVLTRVMEVLQKEGKTADAMKMYSLKIPAKEKSVDKILAAIKKQFNIVVSKEAISKPEIKEAVNNDIKKAKAMMINGTPTIYFDGKFDQTRSQYKTYLK